MTEAAAWRSWRRRERLARAWAATVRRVEANIERLSLELAAAHDAQIVEMLTGNPRYLSTIRSFLNLRGYRKDMDGWRAACGTDRGLYKKTAYIGWPRLWRILLSAHQGRR